MYVITTRIPNELLIEIVNKGSRVQVKTHKEFEVITSDEITSDMLRFSESGMITFAEVNEINIVPTTENIPRRGRTRHRDETPKSEEDTNNSEEKDEENK